MHGSMTLELPSFDVGSITLPSIEQSAREATCVISPSPEMCPSSPFLTLNATPPPAAGSRWPTFRWMISWRSDNGRASSPQHMNGEHMCAKVNDASIMITSRIMITNESDDSATPTNDSVITNIMDGRLRWARRGH